MTSPEARPGYFRTGRFRHGLPLVGSFFLLLFGLAACGGEEAGDPEGDDPGSPRAEEEGGAVSVELDEYAIVLRDTLPAGRHTLRIRNRGFEEHDLVVRPKGSDEVTWETDRRLNPGEVRSVEIELEPGTYAVLCTVSNHESRGMFADLVVTEPSGS